MSFDRLGLSPELLRAVAQQGYTEPTPVQTQAIPLVLAGRDVLAGAQTGHRQDRRLRAADAPASARVAARRRAARHPRAGPHPDPRARAPGRGERPDLRRPEPDPLDHRSTAASASTRRSARCAPGPEIVVATPGRLLDHLGQRTIDLSRVEILVLDEADRMLDMGFIRDIRKILAVLPPRRQNLLFSATFSDEIRRLADGLLDDPASVQVTPAQHADRARHPGRPHGRPRAQARAAQPPHHDRPDRPGARLHPDQARRQPARAAARDTTASSRPRSTATRASRSASARWPTSRPAASRSSSPPRSPRAGSTSRRSRTSSTSSCRWSPRTTSTASAGPGGRAWTATPSRWSASTSSSSSTTSSASSAAASRARRSRASSPIRASDPSRSCAVGSVASRPSRSMSGIGAPRHAGAPRPGGGSLGRAGQPRPAGHPRPVGAPRTGAPVQAGAARPSRRPSGGSASTGRRRHARSGGSHPGNRGAGFAGPRRPGQGIGNGQGPRPAEPGRSPGQRPPQGQHRSAGPGTVMPGERLARHGGRPAALIARRGLA